MVVFRVFLRFFISFFLFLYSTNHILDSVTVVYSSPVTIPSYISVIPTQYINSTNSSSIINNTAYDFSSKALISNNINCTHYISIYGSDSNDGITRSTPFLTLQPIANIVAQSQNDSIIVICYVHDSNAAMNTINNVVMKTTIYQNHYINLNSTICRSKHIMIGADPMYTTNDTMAIMLQSYTGIHSDCASVTYFDITFNNRIQFQYNVDSGMDRSIGMVLYSYVNFYGIRAWNTSASSMIPIITANKNIASTINSAKMRHMYFYGINVYDSTVPLVNVQAYIFSMVNSTLTYNAPSTAFIQ